MDTLFKLINLIPESLQYQQKLVDMARQYLRSANCILTKTSLKIIGLLTPISTYVETKNVLELVKYYFDYEDARVRSQAFSTIINLHERGITLDPNIYLDVCKHLRDDYEIVRQVVLKVIWLLGVRYPEQ